MSDDTSTRFPKLNDSNYASWSIMMEAELIRKSLWTNIVEMVIDIEKKPDEKKTTDEIKAEFESMKSKRKSDKMAQARSEMILRVDPGQLSHMTSKDPMEIWEKLKNVHRGRGFATSLALKRKFLTSKKGRTQTMQAWVGNIRAQAFEMEMAGIDVNEQDVILALTLGLSSSYDAIIISFDGMDPEKLTVDAVITRLLNEETRQSGGRTHTSTPTHHNHSVDDDSALAVMHTSRHPLSEITCFFCTKKGHFRSDCPDRKAWEKSRGEGAHVAEEAFTADEDWDSNDDAI